MCGLDVLRVHVFSFFSFFFSFFHAQPAIVDKSTMNNAPMHCSRVPQITLFSNFFIKNGFHSTIYTFKNYFTTVFLVSVFNFSKNKLYPNGPITSFHFPWLPTINSTDVKRVVHTSLLSTSLTRPSGIFWIPFLFYYT